MSEHMMKFGNYQVERDCTISHAGFEYTQLGAYLSNDLAVGYLKFDKGEYIGARGKVTTWHGDYMGDAYITGLWKVKSYYGPYMLQVDCNINGVKYTGRSFGSGSIWKGKPRKHQ